MPRDMQHWLTFVCPMCGQHRTRASRTDWSREPFADAQVLQHTVVPGIKGFQPAGKAHLWDAIQALLIADPDAGLAMANEVAATFDAFAKRAHEVAAAAEACARRARHGA